MPYAPAFIAATSGNGGSLDDAARAAAVLGAHKPNSRPANVWSTHAAALSIESRDLFTTVFGQLACSDMPALQTAIRKANSASQVAEYLSSQYWGSYVAFIQDRDGLFAFRDPSGAVPLYISRNGDTQIASTRMTPAFLATAGHRWRVNQGIVAKLLGSPPAPAFLSALADIEIVTPGELVCVNSAAVRRRIWCPRTIAARGSPLQPEQLVDTLDQVLSQLAGQGRVGVELSGGVDSSIVFSSLARLGLDPTPFNFATAGSRADDDRVTFDVPANGRLVLSWTT